MVLGTAPHFVDAAASMRSFFEFTMPNYTKVQFVSYQTPTVMLNSPGVFEIPAPKDRLGHPLTHAWHLKNDDARNRVLRFYEAAEFSRKKGAAALGGRDTLKIFIAPEFYFRDAVSLDSYHGPEIVTNIYAALLAAFAQPEYEDWLVIAGSIFWHQRAPGLTYFNTVCTIRGGASTSAAGRSPGNRGIPHVMNGTTNLKALMSHIDYAFNPITGEKIDKRRDDAAINPYFSPIFGDWAWQKEHLFTVRDFYGPTGKLLVFGLEVCLEHAHYAPGEEFEKHRGALKYALLEWEEKEPETPWPMIDIHMVTSCGMELIPSNVCAKVGGHAMICDGSYPARSHMHLVLPNEGNRSMTPMRGALADEREPLWREALHTETSIPPRRMRIGNDLVEVPESIVIYPAVMLA